jgi:drug/metabolite transporter (DMT)-like permease
VGGRLAVFRMTLVPAPASQRLKAITMLLAANFFWGLSFPVIKSLGLLHAQLIPEAGSWFSALYLVAPRFVLATVALALWLRPAGWRVTRGELVQGGAIGLFAAGGMLLQNDGLQFTEASTSAFLTQLYAVLIPVWLAVRARRGPGVVVWVCCALVLAGVAILGRLDWRTLRMGRGEVETLLSSLFFMGQILWLSRREFAANRPLQVTLIMCAVQAVIFTAAAVTVAPDVPTLIEPWTSPAWLALTLTLTAGCTLVAYLLMNTWQPKITATEAGLVYCVEPIFGSAMALFLPAWISGWAGIAYANETATVALLVGGALITAANVLIQLKPPKA